MNPGSDLARLMATFPRQGKVEWIGTRPKRRAALVSLEEVEAVAAHGLIGDHYATKSNGKRQMTLIQAEHLAVVAQLLGVPEVAAASLRRNIAVSGINLFALRGREFTIGEVLLEGTGACEPCSRMEEVLGPGGYNAMRGHGGIICRILKSGQIRLGDAVGVPGEPD
ncbi:MAG TPA: MOSC domain-containing protein [Burkholderiales bacterium]|nr:MOSC domain-containing protein [Burkholderiales bacterium]